ncbi:pirin family protein [Robbsia sp. Bb-Pol-6]|uniref:Pirin family protein n=1 Tax=Robbsia betulipollinis TaxID=2981849 RepID=A0ABT3ZH18_9BURK|nr:pirin family protein [Robbsia betulipollinis]MCY0385819.1 pirin family protein [Robbsia betulipollinis]
MTSRTIDTRHPAHRDDIGDLSTRRPLPGPGIEQLDPFLFLNHHGPQTYPPHNRGLPFGPHPHRGFETVTFILEGELAHLDTGGHESVIRAGGVQWMTAGSGLVHAEISPEPFKRAGGPLEILQLWVNLPARLKMTRPAYTGLQREEIPQLSADDGKARIELVSGEWDGHTGPIVSLTGVEMMVLNLSPGARLTLPAPAALTVFLYVVRGRVAVAGEAVPAFTLARLRADGDTVVLSADEDAVVLFGRAAPIGEPVVSHGPFVMNTREEIQQAIHDYQAGLFGNSLDDLRA